MISNAAPPIAILGAGPGGLSAAMLLAASGLRVRIYEAQPEIGGRTGRLTVDGFGFDRGPTFFLMPYVLEEIFSAAGRRLGDEVELTRLDPMYRLIVGQGPDQRPITLDATQDLDRMAARIGRIEPRDAEGFGRFIRDNRAKLRLMEPILRSPIRSPLDLLKFPDPRLGLTLKPHLSVFELSERYFSHPAVKLAVGFQSKYLGMSPYNCPSLFTILPFIEYEYGVWHPTGGCHAIIQAMARACTDMGVEIITDAPVQSIDFDGRRARAVVTRGQRHAHDHILINADATWALKNLIPPSLRPDWTDQRIDSARYSCSTCMLYLGVRGEVDLPHHTIAIASDYKGNLDDISIHGRLSDEPSMYVCNPSAIDPTLAPPGCSSLYVLLPTPNTRSDIDWNAQRPALRARMMDQLRTRFGIHDIEDRIVIERMVTPADWQGANITFGATFNLAHNLGQMLHRRPQHRMPGADGVWFVGGGTHPGSGLPVIFLSSQITARLVCDELGVDYAGDAVPTMSSTEPAHVA